MTVSVFDCPKCGLEVTNGQIGARVRNLKCCTSEERFWAKVDKSAGAESCWPWKGAVHRDGYGRAHDRDGAKKMKIAHRLCYEYAKGAIPDGLDVCHSCDNPICCNPAHLWTGTASDNMRDMHRKGRWPRSKRTDGDKSE